MKTFFDYRKIIEIVEVVFTIMVIICTNITIYARQNNENERLIPCLIRREENYWSNLS